MWSRRSLHPAGPPRPAPRRRARGGPRPRRPPQLERRSPAPALRASPSTTASGLLDRYRWGLVPSWSKDPSIANRLFNARGETVAEKPSFRSAFAKRPCVIPVDGFYEWDHRPGRQKQPHYFTRIDGEPLLFAGLYEHWRDPNSPKTRRVAARPAPMITTTPSDDMDETPRPHARRARARGRRDLARRRASTSPTSALQLLRPAPEGHAHALRRRHRGGFGAQRRSRTDRARGAAVAVLAIPKSRKPRVTSESKLTSPSGFPKAHHSLTRVGQATA